MLAVGPHKSGILETLVCRILMFMWPLGTLLKAPITSGQLPQLPAPAETAFPTSPRVAKASMTALKLTVSGLGLSLKELL